MMDVDESGFCGRLIVDPKPMGFILGRGLQGSHFRDPAASAVFGALSSLAVAGEQIGASAVLEHLRAKGEHTDAAERIVIRGTAAPLRGSVTAAAEIVIDNARFRRLEVFGQVTSEAARSRKARPEELCQAIYAKVSEIMAEGAPSDDGTLNDTLDGIIAQMEQGAAPGLSYSLPSLDKITGGARGGQLICIAGISSSGKTALAVQMLNHLAIDQGVPCKLYTLEVDKREVAYRLLSHRTGIAFDTLRAGFKAVPRNRVADISAAHADIAEGALSVNDNSSTTIADIAGDMMRLKRDGIELVVIDQLDLLVPRDQRRGEKRGDLLRDCTISLKKMARAYDIPVVILHQFNRGPAGKDLKGRVRVPTMWDLRDGAIENDLDLAVFTHRPAVILGDECPDDLRNVAHAVIGKHRSGPRGSVPCIWNGAAGRFTERSAS